MIVTTHRDPTEPGKEAEPVPSRRPCLPRQGWQSQYAFLKALFRVRQALEEAEGQGGRPPLP